MKTKVFCVAFLCVFVLWLFTPLLSYGQDELKEIRDDLQSYVTQIDQWERTATAILALNVTVGVLGVVAGLLQKSQANWSKIATVIVGASVSIITIINTSAFDVDRPTLRRRVIQGREIIEDIRAMMRVGIPKEEEHRRAWYEDYKKQVHLLIELGNAKDKERVALQLSLLPVAYAQSAQKSYQRPLWVAKPPTDPANLYFLGEGANPSLEKVKEISRNDAAQRAVEYLSSQFRNARREKGAPLDVEALARYLVNSAEVADTYVTYDPDVRSYRNYTLLRLHKDVAESDMKVFGYQSKAGVPPEFYEVVHNAPGLGKAYPPWTVEFVVTLQDILVKQDGSPGATGWRFEVMGNGRKLFQIPKKAYNDKIGQNSYTLTPADQAQAVFVGPQGQSINIEVIGRRTFGNGPGVNGKGIVSIARADPIAVKAAANEKNGFFLFHFSVQERPVKPN